MKALISIKPRYARALFGGSKRYEFRRVKMAREVSELIVYASSPVKKLLGLLEVEKVIEGTPKELWAKCKEGAGMTAAEFRAYFAGAKRGVAIEIARARIFSYDIEPGDIDPKFIAPQSFRYVDDGYIGETVDFPRLRYSFNVEGMTLNEDHIPAVMPLKAMKKGGER